MILTCVHLLKQIATGLSSPSNECRACWKWTFHLWYNIKIENQISWQLGWCISCWKVLSLFLYSCFKAICTYQENQ